MGTETTETVGNPAHPAKRAAFTMAKALAIIIPAVASSYFSYRQAVVESVTGASVTKAKAEAGYQTLVNATEKASKVISDLEKDHARLEGRLLALEARLNTSGRSAFRAGNPGSLGNIGRGGSGSINIGNISGSGSGASHTPIAPSPPTPLPPSRPSHLVPRSPIHVAATPPIEPITPLLVRPPTVFKPLPRTLDQAQIQMPNLPATPTTPAK